MQEYSFGKTLKKAGGELLLVVGAAVAGAVGGALVNTASIGLELPPGETGVMVTAILAAVGRAFINWAKNRRK